MIWWVMVACGLLTFAARFVMFSDIAPKKLPGWSEDVLSFVPVAVLTAIIVPSVMIGMDGARSWPATRACPPRCLPSLWRGFRVQCWPPLPAGWSRCGVLTGSDTDRAACY